MASNPPGTPRKKGRKNSSHKETSIFRYSAKMKDGTQKWYRTSKQAWSARVASNGKYDTGAFPPEERRAAAMRKPQNQDAVEAYPFFDRVTASEQRFLRFAASKSILVIAPHRNGWPDFFCENPAGGGLAAVEVKKGIDDTLRPGQAVMFSLIEQAGVQVFVWNPQWTKRHGGPALVPWREYVENTYYSEWPGTDPGGKATGQSTRSGQSDHRSEPPHENPVSEDGRNPGVLDDPRLLH